MRLKHEFASRSVKTLGLSVAVAAGLMWSAAPAFADVYRLDYSIHHSKYGNIGSYSNTIDNEGQNTTVTTKENIAVKVLGITAHRQNAERVEKWNGDRLTYFHAVTDINGKSTPVDGVAQGDHFQITSPKGATEAPANIRIANPWSPKLMNGDTILLPDDGTVSKVQITPAQDTMVKVGGNDVQAKLYDINFVGTNKHYQVWFDSSGTPVMFNQVDNSGTVTFTLNAKTPVSPAIASATP
jgi:hypothetical protein